MPLLDSMYTPPAYDEVDELELALQEAYESGINDGYEYALNEYGNTDKGKALLRKVRDRAESIKTKSGFTPRSQKKIINRVNDRLWKHSGVGGKIREIGHRSLPYAKAAGSAAGTAAKFAFHPAVAPITAGVLHTLAK